MTELNGGAFESAINGDKPAVVDFWAAWCMPCKIFAPVMQEVSEQLEGKVDFYKMNLDENLEIAQKYEITSIPTVMVFKDGAPVDTLIGVRGRDEVAQMIEKHVQQ